MKVKAPTKIRKIMKRDGKIVDFDPTKITRAIYKAAEAVGHPDFELAQKLSDKVIGILGLKRKKIPTVEEIQDIVEQVLMAEGEARIAKAYILYRQRRAEIRKEKQQILNKIEIDKVDKAFDVNALRVLCSRYLRKDNDGKIIESPRELFERVAIHTTLASIFFDKKVFQKGPKGSKYRGEEFEPKNWVGKIKIGEFSLNQFHLECLKRVYDRFNGKGQLKLSWSKFLEFFKNGEFDNYEKEIKAYYNLMAGRKFMPNTPALANFGNYLGMGSACFVLGIDDSIESIMDTLKQASVIFKAGGGAGYNFSNLRPEGDFVKSTGGVASGPISFMTLFDRMTEVIKQGGIRRGANMGILNSDHPDIEKFITAKKENRALRNFNISVFIRSDFWNYYKENKPYPLINPRTKEIVKYVEPKNLLNLIAYQAWESAEPGVIYDDMVNRYNPFLDNLGPIQATNPCVTGDTLVAVADGRNYVSIKQLAQEGKDVLVYCFGDGEVQIRMGRNPRKTRENVPVWKVILDDGSYIIATADHKFRDINNNEIELKDLRPGAKLLSFYLFPDENLDTLLHNYDVKAIEFAGHQNVYNITVDEFHTVAYVTNPESKTRISGIITSQCGEVLLYPYESCNLGSINLWAFVKETPTNGGNRKVEFDWKDFENTVHLATKFLDNVVEVNKYPLKEIEEMTLNTRKIGLGVMGLGNLLYDLEIPYNSDQGYKFMEKIMEFVNYHSKLESIKLARERGKFPYYNKSFYPGGKLAFSGFYDKNSWNLDWDGLKEKVKKYGLRNTFTTVIAPTGSISMIAGCSSGIEPVFSLVYEKRVTVGSFYYIDPVFEKIMLREGLFDEDLIRETAERNGSIQNLTYIPAHLKKIFVTSMDIKAPEHIKALASFQKWTDSSISKTINFPQNATIEEVREAILLAHKLGCKDLTIYRNKSIKGVLVAGERKKKERKPQKLTSLTDVKAKGPSIYHEAGTVLEEEARAEIEICPNCGGIVVREEGCRRCLSCGWGVCSV